MATMKIKKGDTVRVIAGADNGSEGKVIAVDAKNAKVIVEGVNVVKRHTKPSMADTFEVGDRVDVVGTSKGKGTAGAIKRWNFGRLKETHGSGPVVRHAGSLGACSDPSRVFKGKKLAGHLGAERVTIQNLDIVKVDAENNLIAIKGAIPGPKGGIVVLKNSIKKA